MNWASLADFSVDLGYQFRRFLNCEDEPLKRLAEAAGLQSAELNDLISWTGRPIGDVRMEFRGEILTSKAVRSPVIRGCKTCLREDAGKAPGNPVSMMALRGDWLMREVSMCCQHQRPLEPLWEALRPVDRYDTGKHFPGHLERILERETKGSIQRPTPYDLWLDERLETGKDPTWLAGHGLFAATTMCSLLGATLSSGSSKSNGDRSTAHQTGFAVLAEGEESLRTALQQQADSAGGAHVAPHQTFGKLYAALGDYLADIQFTPFRTILRECILETWPIAAGDVVLGETVPERILHTPTTAAKETGLGTRLVEQFLVDAGAIPENDDRPFARRTFDAVKYSDLLAEIVTLVGPLEMQAAIGATKAQLRSLRDDGVLVPRIAKSKIKSPWRIADGLDLLSELDALAVSISEGKDGWEDIQSASKRKRLRVGNIIEAVRQAELTLGRVNATTGYRFLMVMKAEINEMAQQVAQSRFHNREASNGIPASAFARSIGMRSEGWFQSLFEAGHVSGSWVHHPVTNVRILYVSDEDITAFNRHFLTLPQMQIEFGLHQNTCAARLRAARVAPFSPHGQDFGSLFEREKVELIMRSMRT